MITALLEKLCVEKKSVCLGGFKEGEVFCISFRVVHVKLLVVYAGPRRNAGLSEPRLPLRCWRCRIGMGS